MKNGPQARLEWLGQANGDGLEEALHVQLPASPALPTLSSDDSLMQGKDFPRRIPSPQSAKHPRPIQPLSATLPWQPHEPATRSALAQPSG